MTKTTTSTASISISNICYIISVSSKTIRLCKSTVSYFIPAFASHRIAPPQLRSNYYVLCSTLGPYSAENLFTFYIHNRFNSTDFVVQCRDFDAKSWDIAFNFRHCRHRTPAHAITHFSSRFIRFYYSLFHFQFFTILVAAAAIAATTVTVTLECDMTHCVLLDYHYCAYAILYLKYMCLLHCATRIVFFSA